MPESRQSNYFVHTLLRARDWQHRPQFDQVCDWWRDGGRGVCALVGMGGAGKTAIAERFLSVLRSVIPAAITASEATQIDPPLPSPHSFFVYSFYDDDKPENFFRRLQVWLEGTASPEKAKSPEELKFDIQQHQGLMILDGLEKVQESGARGGFGKLTSPSLRDLLNHIADGSAHQLSVLVTSRFSLTDLRDSQPRFFHTIAIEEIDVAAGVALLRDLGVRGTDAQLATIVEHCGRHALTVDLAGGYIKEYGAGDPTTPLNLGTPEELEAEAEQEPDDDKRAVLKQGIRFSRIAQRYRQAMLENNDKATLALLERICLFRSGVDCEKLASIFTGPDAEEVAGKALASLDADQLSKKLAWLVKMRLVEPSETISLNTEALKRKTLYTIHPAVQDGFLSGINRDDATASHQAILGRLVVSLGDLPGRRNPSDTATLDTLEEIIHHTLQSGYVREAWDIYCNRIGGVRNLGWRLGEYERGERICKSLAGGASLMLIEQLASLGSSRGEFVDTWCYYLRYLGRLSDALIGYEKNAKWDKEVGDQRGYSLSQRNVVDVLTLMGFLRRALQIAKALDDCPISGDERSRITAAIARIYSDSGQVRRGLSTYRSVFNQHHRPENAHRLFDIEGLEYILLMMKLGRFKNAADLLTAARNCQSEGFGEESFHLPKCDLAIASLETERKALQEALDLCQSARDRAKARGAKEITCWSALVQARFELAAADDRKLALKSEGADHLAAAQSAIAEGLKIARDCGYGLFHIDLLLERAHLHLLRGDASPALADIELALDTGIPANDQTGQVELLAANHEECGYAWPIPTGLQLRAEALLLQAANTLQRDSFAPAKISESPTDVVQLIDRAKQYLNEALDRWRDLRDPEPTEDNKFVHPETGEEYNYRAAETHQVLQELAKGLLTQYELKMLPFPEGLKMSRQMNPQVRHKLEAEHGITFTGEVLGYGSFGVVEVGKWENIEHAFKVSHFPIDRMDPKGLTNKEFEALDVIKSLDHRCLVKLIDYLVVAVENHQQIDEFLVTIWGKAKQTLQDHTPPIAVDDLIRYLADVAEAVDYLHQRGVRHRDIKPNNIFLHDDGHARLGDLGLIKLMGLSIDGSIAIGHDFAPPELRRDKLTHPTGDLYSIAATYVWGRTGDSLLRSESDLCAAGLYPDEAKLLARALDENPNKREMVGAAAFLDQLQRAVQEFATATTLSASNSGDPAHDMSATMNSQQILSELNSLVAAQFEQVVFLMNAHALIPGRQAPQADRALELVRLVQSQGDSGLAKLRKTIDQLKWNRP